MQDAKNLKEIQQRIYPPMVEGDHTFGTVSDKIGDVTLKKKTPFHWFIGFGIAFMIAQLLLFTVVTLLARGIGIWGNNQPVGWAFDIINFVWWIGIGHAGTLISAILLLLNQKWRTSINRFAEAMTLFAVACAAMFPLLHTGRPWLAAYWLFPYPNTMGIWPQFRSPLIWDVFAVSTYATISLLFWYVGLIPDLATLRDRAKNKFFKFMYGILSWGWRGSAISGRPWPCWTRPWRSPARTGFMSWNSAWSGCATGSATVRPRCWPARQSQSPSWTQRRCGRCQPPWQPW